MKIFMCDTSTCSSLKDYTELRTGKKQPNEHIPRTKQFIQTTVCCVEDRLKMSYLAHSFTLPSFLFYDNQDASL